MKNLPRHEVKNLLNRIEKGDDTACARLYSAYQSDLYAYVRYRVWDDAGAEEVVVDTFHAAFRKPGAYHGLSEYSTWVCGIANNKIREWRRKNVKYTREIGGADTALFDAVQEPEWDVATLLDEREMGEALLKCIDKLPDAQREAIYWTAVENCSVEEAGVKSGAPAGTIKSRLFHARRVIRACLERAIGSNHAGERIG